MIENNRAEMQVTNTNSASFGSQVGLTQTVEVINPSTTEKASSQVTVEVDPKDSMSIASDITSIANTKEPVVSYDSMANTPSVPPVDINTTGDESQPSSSFGQEEAEHKCETVDTRDLPKEHKSASQDYTFQMLQEGKDIVSSDKSSFIPRGLSGKTIYALSTLEKKGYKFASLSVNRALNQNALKQKCKSIKECGGVLTPSLIVSADSCIAEGLKVELADGTIVEATTAKKEKILVIIDGQHRHKAITELNSKDLFVENYFHFPFSETFKIRTALKEANVATRAWKGGDFLTSAIIALKEKNEDTSKLEKVQELIKLGSETAAWRWATLKLDEMPRKNVLSSIIDGKKNIADIAKFDHFESGIRLYKALNVSFSPNFLGLKVVPAYFIDMINKGKKEGRSIEETVSIIVSWTKNVNRNLADKFEALKAGEGKTKDQRIQALLNQQFYKFQSNNN